jgi:hypothetical protein
MSEVQVAAPTPTPTPDAAPNTSGNIVAAPTSAGGPQTGDIGSAAKEAMRKLKIDNEEVDEAEVIKVFKSRKEHQRAASRELNEGKALRKQAEDLISMIKDPDRVWDVIDKLGHDSRTLAERRLAAALEDELMDPRDKELRDTKAKLKHYDEMERLQKEAVQKQRHEELKTKYMKEYEGDFVKALESTKLPPTKPMVAEMAKYIARSAKIGFEMTPLEAAQMVKEDIETLVRNVSVGADGEMLLKILGEDAANKIRKYDTDKIKTPEQMLQTPENQDIKTNQRTTKRKKTMSHSEWRLHKRGLR